MTAASLYTGTRTTHPTDSQGTRTKKVVCVYCKGEHTANKCEVITDHQRRLDVVKKEKLCFNCLAHHRVSECRSKHRCNHCKRKHHTSLCTGGGSVNAQSDTNTNDKVSTNHALLSTIPAPINTQLNSLSQPNCKMTTCLLKTAIASVTAGDRHTRANILFDDGAQRSFVTQKLATLLKLDPKNKENICISSFGATSPSYQLLSLININVESLIGEQIPVSALIVPSIATPLQNTFHTCIKDIPHLQDLTLAHPLTGNENFEISLLIGADHYWNFIGDHIIRGSNGPIAMQSKLGYLLSGPLPTPQTSFGNQAILHVAATCQEGEQQQINFWSMESTGTANHKKVDDDFLSQYQRSCITYDPDGGYTAKFPWKIDHAPLPTNYAVCARRTRSLVRRLQQVPDFADQERRGFIEKVPASSNTSGHYIPHHAVEKTSPTTPIRIVYDCSCRQSKDHPSLNDCLMVGLPFQNDICAIMIRFRFHVIGLSTDIEKAFLHVKLHEEDRDYTRFLWLSKPSDPESTFQTYRFKSVLFGSTSSPFMLNATLHYHLNKFKSPVAEDMKGNLYVDEIISGTQSETHATKYYTEARSIMTQAKFNLRSWASNSKQLQSLATVDNVANNSTNVNILGLIWNTSTDTITFTSKETPSTDTTLFSK